VAYLKLLSVACLEGLSKTFRNSKIVDLWSRIQTREVVVVAVYKLEY